MIINTLSDRVTVNGIIEELGPVLASFRHPVVCFSGGYDSTALLRNALEFCDDVTALFVVLPMNTQRQIDSAGKVAEHLGADLTVARLGWDDLKGIENNGPDRCYICKKAIYSLAKAIAVDSPVLAGDNADDRDDERPGHRAAEDKGVINPLKDAGIGKSRIIRAVEELKLPFPMFKDTCMATRYPVGHPITERDMRFAEGCESAVRKVSGLKQLRIRIDGNRALVQTDESELPEMVRRRTQITYELKSRGLDCDLDLEPYKGL